jgi:4-amino-4-deoxy-L-arabinose transferase-like glycosyltransferase
MSWDARYRLILLTACLVLFTANLGGRDFWEPDEPRYAGIARGIAESGDYLSLTENGRPYTHKPPLYFWLLAAVGRLGSGVTALSARIPNSLLAIAVVFLLYRLGRDHFSPLSGLFGALVLATTQRFFLEARWVHLDMLLTLVMIWALDESFRALERRERWRWILVYLAAGLGCLTKGPVALALPAAVLITFLASTRELSRLKETGWWLGIPAALLPAALWLWVFSRSAGFDPAGVVRIHVFQRLWEGVHHPRPIYYYFLSLPLEFLPWTPFLAGAFVSTFPRPGGVKSRPTLFLYGWIVGGLALFSLAAEKRPSYLLPILPPLALLIGLLFEDYLIRWDASPIRKWIGAPLLAYSAICLGGVLWIPFGAKPHPGLADRLLPLGILYLVTFAAALTALRLGRRGATLVLLLAGFWGGYLWIAGALLPWLNDYKSARPFSERILARIGPAPLGIFKDYNAGLGFYTRRRTEVIRRRADLQGFLSQPGGAFCLVPSGDYDYLRRTIPLQEWDREAVGHRVFVLVSRAEATSSPP